MIDAPIGQQRRQLGVRFATYSFVGMVIELLIEPIGRHFCDRRSTLADQLPILLKVFGPGKPATHADDC